MLWICFSLALCMLSLAPSCVSDLSFLSYLRKSSSLSIRCTYNVLLGSWVWLLVIHYCQSLLLILSCSSHKDHGVFSCGVLHDFRIPNSCKTSSHPSVKNLPWCAVNKESSSDRTAGLLRALFTSSCIALLFYLFVLCCRLVFLAFTEALGYAKEQRREQLLVFICWSRPGWTKRWATWCSGWHPPWDWNQMIFKVLSGPSHSMIAVKPCWFMLGVLSLQGSKEKCNVRIAKSSTLYKHEQL